MKIKQKDGTEGERVERVDAEQKTGEQPPAEQRGGGSDGEAQRGGPNPASHLQPEHVAGPRPERHAEADLAGAPADGVRDESGDADRRQDEPDRTQRTRHGAGHTLRQEREHLRGDERGPGSAGSGARAEELRSGLTAAALVARAGVLASANDLLPATSLVVPALVPFKRALSRRLGRPVGLSGSGPTLWALYDSEAEAVVAAETVREGLRDGSLSAPGPSAPWNDRPLRMGMRIVVKNASDVREGPRSRPSAPRGPAGSRSSCA